MLLNILKLKKKFLGFFLNLGNPLFHFIVKLINNTVQFICEKRIIAFGNKIKWSEIQTIVYKLGMTGNKNYVAVV